MSKGVLPANRRRGYEPSSFPKTLWATLSKDIPQGLTPEASGRLNKSVADCCAWLIREQMLVEDSKKFSSHLMQRHSKKGLAPFEKFPEKLQQAADAWKVVREIYHDPRLGDISQFDKLEDMASDAKSHLEGLRTLERRSLKSRLPEFVQKVAALFHREGIPPEATGRIYEKSRPTKAGKPTKDASPTWFQKFMITLKTEFIDKEASTLGLTELKVASAEAFSGMVAKAKPGRLSKIRKAGN